MKNDTESIQKLKSQIKELKDQLDWLTFDYHMQTARANDLQNDFHSGQSELFNYYIYSHELKELCKDLKKELDEVYSSTRWKLTGPAWALISRLSPPGNPSGDLINSSTGQTVDTVTQLAFLPDKTKKNILVIDRGILRPDHDAGSLSVFQYCKLLLEMGFDVYFWGDDFGDLFADDTSKYINFLEEAGIHVLFGEDYYRQYNKWLSQNAFEFDFVVLNRPNIASKYIDLIRAHSQAKIVYLGHDLHFLREMGDYKCTGNPLSLERSIQLKTKEYWVMHRSDWVIMYSHQEKELIKKEFDIKNVLAAPIYYFDECQSSRKDFKYTKDILFVGGFSHKPNLDAVLWFYKEIWPSIMESLPEAKWHIIGSAPPKEVLDLASERILVPGFVPDELLNELYKNCRVCVVPLRFGAGVKGKTIQAMKYGIPIVSTSLGIEGIEGIDKIIPSSDCPVDFIDQVKMLYNNEDIAVNQSRNALEYFKNHFSKEVLIRVLEEVFDV